MSPRGTSIAAGIVLVALCGAWLGYLMTAPTLTYHVRYDNVVRLKCQTIYAPNGGGIRAPSVENVEGTAEIRVDESLATISGDTEADEDDVLVITESQLSADCAGARIERVQWLWLPVLGMLLGVVLACLGGRRSAATPVPPPAGPPHPPTG